jgi:hypothetical protein
VLAQEIVAFRKAVASHRTPKESEAPRPLLRAPFSLFFTKNQKLKTKN